MDKELDSVCPIFVRYENDIFEQIGSGVLLRIKDKMFILTAAHVSDWSGKGDLCIPTKNGIQAIVGYFASILSPKGLRRSKDKIDMSYYQLDHSLVKKMHEDFKPLHRNECWLTDNTLPDDLYTFSGFPLNKSKKDGNIFSSEMFSYSGAAAIPKKYKNLGYSPNTNIIVNFRRKKSVDSTGIKRIPPHPKGISGGAIFRWPKHINKGSEHIHRSLVGIGHTYLQQHNCLIGTKLSLYYQFISKNNPDLFETNQKKDADSIPMFHALVYYKKEEWPLLMSQFDDANHMQNSWQEWRHSAENAIEQMHRDGKLIVPIEISADEINEYCKSKNILNTGKARIDLASKKLAEMLRESKII